LTDDVKSVLVEHGENSKLPKRTFKISEVH